MNHRYEPRGKSRTLFPQQAAEYYTFRQRRDCSTYNFCCFAFGELQKLSLTNKIFILFIIIIFNLTANLSYGQAAYEILQDEKHPEVKVLKGLITKSIIESDTASFKWYAANQKYYQPDTAIIGALKRNNKVQYMVFGGTWCEDTQFILPKFFKLQEKAGIIDSNTVLFGVNRDKKTLGNIASAFNITNVPTIIVMKEGKEIGRVVEYGKTGKWDKELADIVSKLK